MDEDAILAAIRLDIEVGNFSTDEEHTAPHMAMGKFSEGDIIAAVLSGEVIEQRPEDDRWLFCGNVPALRHLPLFRGRWLHVSVEYDENEVTATGKYAPYTTGSTSASSMMRTRVLRS